MEVDHPSRIFSQSTHKEFEFQSFSSSSDRDHTTTSPADELFYMGKLLPLQTSTSFHHHHHPDDVDSFSTPLFTPTSATPFESCNVSPAESRHVSREIDPDEYLAHFFSGLDQEEKKSWPSTKKNKMVKQSTKMKWTSYLKSFFHRSSGCSDEYSAAADHRQFLKAKQCANGHCRNATPFGQIKYDINRSDNRGGGGHRRSFSGAFKRLSAKPNKTSTAGSNANSLSLNRSVYKKCVSNSEIDSPIQAAIAHCKRSQNSRKIGDEIAFSIHASYD